MEHLKTYPHQLGAKTYCQDLADANDFMDSIPNSWKSQTISELDRAVICEKVVDWQTHQPEILEPPSDLSDTEMVEPFKPISETTGTPYYGKVAEPKPRKRKITFSLKKAARVLVTKPKKGDLSVSQAQKEFNKAKNLLLRSKRLVYEAKKNLQKAKSDHAAAQSVSPLTLAPEITPEGRIIPGETEIDLSQIEVPGWDS